MSRLAMSSVALFGVVSAVALSIVFSSPQSVTLTTSLGDVLGLRKPVFHTHIEVYYRIPFAQPPTGHGRFRPPKPADPWGPNPIDGTVKPHACWQGIDEAFGRFSGVEMWNPNTRRSEDCLYLNVWRPSNSGQNDKAKTIMVWIFGGGFWSGSPVLDIYDGSELAARKDVIVVTINYRLGPLGFMYLDDPKVPGNAGLMDQVMALQWVKDNAVNLGGSPDEITIFGESAGAASVGFHLLSPLSRDLFKNAIMQSSSPISSWAVTDKAKAKDRSARLAANVSCPVSLGEGLVPCLQRVDPEVLTNQQWILADKWFDVPVAPIVDGTFLPQHPNDMIKAGDIKKTDVILGVDLNEGIYWDIYGFMSELPLSGRGEMNNQQFDTVMEGIADGDTDFSRDLAHFYFKEEGATRASVVDAASGDLLFKCSVVDFAREYTQVGGRVYLYSFEENFSSNPWPNWMGVPHGYEIEVIFGSPLSKGSTNTQQEKDLTKRVMLAWTKFAKDGSPASKSIDWPLYTVEDEEYVVINVHGFQSQQHLRKAACEMWAARHGANIAEET